MKTRTTPPPIPPPPPLHHHPSTLHPPPESPQLRTATQTLRRSTNAPAQGTLPRPGCPRQLPTFANQQPLQHTRGAHSQRAPTPWGGTKAKPRATLCHDSAGKRTHIPHSRPPHGHVTAEALPGYVTTSFSQQVPGRGLRLHSYYSQYSQPKVQRTLMQVAHAAIYLTPSRARTLAR